MPLRLLRVRGRGLPSSLTALSPDVRGRLLPSEALCSTCPASTLVRVRAGFSTVLPSVAEWKIVPSGSVRKRVDEKSCPMRHLFWTLAAIVMPLPAIADILIVQVVAPGIWAIEGPAGIGM